MERNSRLEWILNAKVKSAEDQSAAHQEQSGPAWALARATLEKYFHRNLNQVKWIFLVAVLVMLASFAVILYGVGLSMRRRISMEPSRLAALSGVVTEFIGATLIRIYRSTMRQATEFMNILERINTVGMGVQILESISEQERQLKDPTKARLVESLLDTRLLNTQDLFTSQSRHRIRYAIASEPAETASPSSSRKLPR